MTGEKSAGVVAKLRNGSAVRSSPGMHVCRCWAYGDHQLRKKLPGRSGRKCRASTPAMLRACSYLDRPTATAAAAAHEALHGKHSGLKAAHLTKACFGPTGTI